MTINTSTPLPKATTDHVKRKAKWLVARRRITASEHQDLEQTVMYELLRRRDRVDETMAQDERFLNTVIKHAIADFLAARNAAVRDHRREAGSLDGWQKTASGKWREHNDSIAEEDVGRRLGWRGMSPEEHRDLHIDVRSAVAVLPAPLRVIVDLLMELGAVRAVARALGRHHSAIYDALRQIKRHFEEAGLAEYFA